MVENRGRKDFEREHSLPRDSNFRHSSNFLSRVKYICPVFSKHFLAPPLLCATSWWPAIVRKIIFNHFGTTALNFTDRETSMIYEHRGYILHICVDPTGHVMYYGRWSKKKKKRIIREREEKRKEKGWTRRKIDTIYNSGIYNNKQVWTIVP